MTATPDRIYGWQDSQLSLARFYGGITFNGASYLVAYHEDRQPLVRQDVLEREIKEKKAKARQDKAEAEAKQGGAA